jgi:hypothetical protein
LFKLLQDGNWLIRQVTIQVLGDMGNPLANEYLERLRNDRELYARSGSEAALKNLKYRQGIIGRLSLLTLRIGLPIVGTVNSLFLPQNLRKAFKGYRAFYPV